jgi:DNA-binding NarL/FixJ family response regulator
MDISMPICNGVEAVRLIRATPELAELRIVMLTIHDDDEHLFAAIRAGANGYLLKNTNSAEFLRGVRAALAGEAILPPKLAARLMDEFARLASQPAPAAATGDASDQELTWREREVLQLIATGASDSEIADQLTLSIHTVKTHVRHILAKLHAVNRRAAVSEAKQRGLM